jgi:hypothetical protein
MRTVTGVQVFVVVSVPFVRPESAFPRDHAHGARSRVTVALGDGFATLCLISHSGNPQNH